MGGNASSTAVHLACPYMEMLTVQRSRDAMPVGRVRCSHVQCREPKTGQQNVQLSSKTKYFAHLGMINLC